MHPTAIGTVAPQARPLALLSRQELGNEFAFACRVALGERRRSRRGCTLDWLHHPMVEAVLHEITMRHLDYEDARDRQMLLFDA